MPTTRRIAPAIRPRVGADLQAVDEVAEALSRFGERYRRRVYTAAERLDCREPAQLASRFAGKEAVLKLLGETDGIDPRDIEIRTGEHGRPVVRLHRRAAEVAAGLGLGPIDLSLSHTGSYAAAVGVAIAAPTCTMEPEGSEDRNDRAGPPNTTDTNQQEAAAS